MQDDQQLLAVGDPAPDVTLPDQDGHDVALSSLWRDRTTAIVFLRHYG